MRNTRTLRNTRAFPTLHLFAFVVIGISFLLTVSWPFVQVPRVLPLEQYKYFRCFCTHFLGITADLYCQHIANQSLTDGIKTLNFGQLLLMFQASVNCDTRNRLRALPEMFENILLFTSLCSYVRLTQ